MVPIKGVAARYRAPVRSCLRLKDSATVGTSSEMILQRKLDLAQAAGATDASEAGRRRRVGAAPTRARTAPRRMVRSIEHLGSELERVLFGDPEVLRNREVHIPRSRPDQVVATAIPELPGQRIAECLA